MLRSTLSLYANSAVGLRCRMTRFTFAVTSELLLLLTLSFHDRSFYDLMLESVDSVNTRIVVIKICYCLPFSLKDLYSSNCCLTRLDHKSELLFPTQGTQVAQHFSILHVRHSRRMTLLRFESDRSTFSTYSNTQTETLSILVEEREDCLR